MTFSRASRLLATLVLCVSALPATAQNNAIECLDPASLETPFSVRHAGNTCPVAVAGNGMTVAVGEQVMLDGRRSFDYDGDALSFTWTLIEAPQGSGATLVAKNQFSSSFEVDLTGTYVAQLTVTDGAGNRSADRVQFSTGNSAPVAVAGTDQYASVGSAVSLDGSGSGDFDRDRIEYFWKLTTPSGSLATLAGATTANPAFTLDVAGDYAAYLTVRDAQGNTAHDTVRISSGNTRPVADTGRGGRVKLGAVMVLDGRGSSDADADALAYNWAILSTPAGSATSLDNATAPQASFLLDAQGSYLVQLTVDDGQLTSEPVTMVVEAAEKAPAPLSDAQREAMRRLSPERAGADTDGDGVPDPTDNCVDVPNPDQRDTDNDGLGNFCDPDLNNDGIVNFTDLQVIKANFFMPGDLDTDLNGDGFTNFADLQIMKSYFFGPPGPPGTLTWINGAGGAWNVATNWSPTSVPGPGSTAIINLNPDVTVTIGAGVIAQAGDLLLDDNLVLAGGTITDTTIGPGDGNLNITVSSAMNNSVLNVPTTTQNGAVLTVTNELTINSTFSINGFSINSGIDFDGTQSVFGTGEVIFNTNFNGNLSEPRFSPAVGSTLTIGADLTIRGNNGSVGRPGANVVLLGTMQCDIASAQMHLRGDSVQIGGTIGAFNNATLRLGGAITSIGVGMNLNNPSGNILLGGTGIGNAALGPATLNGTPGSSLTLTPGAHTFDAVTSNVDMTAQNGSVITVSNGLTMNGDAEIQGFSLNTGFDFAGTQALAGTGTFTFNTNFNGALSEPRIRPEGAGSTLTIGPGITIRGNNGTVGQPTLATIMQGSIIVDVSGAAIHVTGDAVSLGGSLAATAGTLRLLGNINTLPGGVVLDTNGGAAIVGGPGFGGQAVGPAQFNGTPGSALIFGSGGHAISAATFNHDVIMQNGAVATVTGGMNINGAVDIQGTSLGTGFDFDGNQFFGGNADITFNTNFNGALAEPRVRPIAGRLTIGGNVDFFGGNGTIGHPDLETRLRADVTNNVNSSQIIITSTGGEVTGRLTTTSTNSRIRMQGTFDNTGLQRGASNVTLDSVDGRLELDGATLTEFDIGAVAGSNIVVTGLDAVLNSSTLDGVALTMVNGAIVTVTGGLTLNGTASIQGTTLDTGLNFDGGTQTLDGVASISFDTNFNGVVSEPRISPINGATLTIGPDITIRGNNGLVGGFDGSTVIQGDIYGDLGSNMWIGGTSFSATGTIRNGGGMFVRLFGNLDNGGQTVTLDDQGTGGIIFGGSGLGFTMTDTVVAGTAPGTVVFVTAEDGSFDDVTLNDLELIVQNGGRVNVANGMTFNSLARIQGTTNPTGFDFSGVQTVDGTGVMTFDTNFNGVISEPLIGPTGGGSVTIGPNITVNGNNGTVGGFGGSTTFQGTIDATLGGTTIEVGGDMTLTGDLTASGGANLRLIGTIDNGGQSFTLEALTGTVIVGPGATLADATINATAGSSVVVTSLNASFDGLTLNGLELIIQNGGIVTVSNGLTFNSNGIIQGTTNPTGFNFSGTQTLGGTGTLTFAANFNGVIAEPQIKALSGTLTIGTGISISGDRGTIGAAGLPLITRAAISAGTSQILVVEGSAVTNTGVIETSGNGNITVNNLTGGAGTLRMIDGTISLPGDVTFANGSVIETPIAGINGFGLLNIGGTADFSNATLGISVTGGFMPSAGNSFEVINYSALAGGGAFGTVTGTNAGGGLTFVPVYNPTDMTLEVQ